MAKKNKQLQRVDYIHKPKPFIKFRLRVVVFFFILAMVICLVYYMIICNADSDNIVTGALLSTNWRL